MRDRLTIAWANLLIAVGLAVMLVALAFGILLGTFGQKSLLGFKPVDDPVVRVTAALVIVLGGFLAGAPVLVAGQLLRLFVGQRRLLAKINHRLLRWDSRAAAPVGEGDLDSPTFGERFRRR